MGQTSQQVKVWPAPDTYDKHVPTPGSPGSFWEDRQDRHHAGVDLYAPPDSPVLATEPGLVCAVHEFTSRAQRPYWNVTYAVLVQCDDGRLIRYAEMSQATVQPGQRVAAGERVGSVGQVLDLDRIDATSPGYIQRLRDKQVHSMLHFEMYSAPPCPEHYLGGNYFLPEPPPGLLDPSAYLREIASTGREIGVLAQEPPNPQL